MALSEAEKKELEALEQSVGGLSPAEVEELRALEADPELQAAMQGAPAPQPEGPGLGAQALDYGMRALDYAGGVGRYAASGYADLARAAQGQEPIGRPEDLQRVLQGQAPTTSEYLERSGAGKMGSAQIPFTDMEVTGRDVVGFAGDVALDPLTYASLGASAVGKLGKAGKAAEAALTPMARGVEKTGEKVYKSAFKNVDKHLADTGTKPLSEVMLKEGAPTGNLKATQDFTVNELMPKYDAQRQALYSQVDEAGATVDPFYAQEKARDVIQKMQNDPGLRDKAADLGKFVDKYAEEGPVSVGQMSEWKTNLYNALPDSAFRVTESGGKQLSNWGKKVQKALSSGFKEQIERAGDFVQPGLGKEIDKVNESWGAVIQSQKPLAREVKKAETKNMLTQVDAMMGGAMLADPIMFGGGLAAKKTVQAASTPRGRTNIGKAMQSAAPWVDPLARRASVGAWGSAGER